MDELARRLGDVKMSKIKYMKDTEFKYSDEIKNGLKNYNRSHTGYREKDSRIFYVLDDDELVGACYTKQESDWCHINRIYYDDIEVLKTLMNNVREYYRDKTEGIQFSSVLKSRTIDFKQIGFDEQGVLHDMPKGRKNVFMLDKNQEPLNINEDYEVKSAKEPIPRYDKAMKKELKQFRHSLDFSTKVIDVQYVALDDGKFAGGIYGNFMLDYLFINILYVNQKYRGRRIASKLIKLIEDEARRRKVNNIYITTFEFQALGLYKKKGYQVVMVIDDYPKGFKEYTVHKKIALK